MEKSAKHLMIVAGEPSGDMHAAHLIKKIKEIDPTIEFSGLGGPKMKTVGVELFEDMTKFAVIGFVEFFKHLGEIKQTFRLLLEKIKEKNPDAVILVDYPGFNLRLAKELKKLNKKVFYYSSPQVWASREGRAQTIRRCVDKMFVFFRFEEEWYAQKNIKVEFIGHPLLDLIKTDLPPESLLNAIGLRPDKMTIGILPGSREKEIERHLPIMIEASRKLYQENNNLQFLILKAPHLDSYLFGEYIHSCNFPIKILHDQTYNGINASDLCMVTSGTATLEVAILQKPMVVIYKTSFLTWLLAKLFIKIPYIGMVNVIAGKKIVPECVQFQATAENITSQLMSVFGDEIRIADMKSELVRIKESLGKPGACQRAAEKILQLI